MPRKRFVPYAYRVAYAGTGLHHVKPSRSPRALLRWAQSAFRDAGDALFGSFAAA